MGSRHEKLDYVECKSFDDALILTGYGRFHYGLFGMCALGLLCSGFQSGLAAYVFTAAQCQLDLSSVQLGYIHMGFMIGGVLSALFWGVMADLLGRKKILLATLPADFIVTLVCCLMPYYYGILICRFLNGFLIGAPSSIIFSYLGEFFPPKRRVKCLCYCGVFFTISWLVLPIISYLILPLPIKITIYGDFEVTSWRVLLFAFGLPELFVSLWLMTLPESPKFWFSKGEERKALEILKQVYTINKGKLAGEYPVKTITDGVKSCAFNQNLRCKGKVARLLGDMISQTLSLFKPPCAQMTFLMSCICFTNMFGYYGLGLWLPELFQRFQRFELVHPHKHVTISELSRYNQTSNQTEPPLEFDETLLQNNTLVGLCCIMGNLLSGYYSGKVNLKVIPIITMLTGGLAAGCIYWLQSSEQYLIMSCIFQAAMATGNTALGSATVVYFPTSVGAMALCLTMLAGRIGAIISNFVFGSFIDTRCEVPIFLVSGCVLIGGLLCCLLPKRGTH